MPHARNRPVALLLLAVALLGLGLAACSDRDDGSDASLTTTTEAESGSGEEDTEGNTVAIDMKDFSFAISGQLEAGTGTVSLTNSGTEMHMAAFALLKEGKTVADMQGALQSGDDSALDAVVAAQVDAPGAILSPGRSQELTTDLLGAGTYAVVCYIPTAGEATPVPHFAKGMVSSFTVAPGAVEATAARADGEYTVDDGKIEGPTTLKAGENALRMTSAGKGTHEFFVAKKSTPSTTFEDIDTFFAEMLEGAAAPPKGYTDTAPGIIAASTFDVASGKTILVTTELEPGDYLIGCAQSDDEDQGGKRHTGEILKVTVT
ncbi:MAG: hypothetical protein ACR2MO_06785 [Acidimicrobiales bacterium]